MITAGSDTGAVTEDGHAGGERQSQLRPMWMSGDDPDLVGRAAAAYGTAAIDPATGQWTYTLNNGQTAVQGLGEGDTLTDSFLVTVTDEDGLDRHA